MREEVEAKSERFEKKGKGATRGTWRGMQALAK